MRNAPSKDRRLLLTLTNEPFQPVRLYYSIPDRAYVSEILRSLECMVQAPEERCWQWLFSAEAASLRFAGGFDDVPKERRPIILGRIRFPEAGNLMTLQTNSIQRAIGAAGFFAPYLGAHSVLVRCRLVNRVFAGEEGSPKELAKLLDRNVTVVDARESEEAFKRDCKDVTTMEEAERMGSESLKRRLENKKDVPMVEDFPLAPEEESSDFSDLTLTLQLRLIRAIERWQGNAELTLSSLIMRLVNDGSLTAATRSR
jgi:hypothetical protein